MADGVHAGDAEGIGHDGVAGAATALRRDAALAGEAHEVPADEEELGQAGALDDLQLVRHLLEHARRDGVVAPRARRRGTAARGRRRASRRRAPGSPGSGSARTPAPPGSALRPPPTRLMPSSQAWRTSGSLSCPAAARPARAALDGVLGVGPAQCAAASRSCPWRIDDEHVLQLAVGAQGVVDVVGDDRGQAGFVGQARQLRHQPVVIGQQVVLQLHVEATLHHDARQPGERPGRALLDRRPAGAGTARRGDSR